jgi:hypothetical protein
MRKFGVLAPHILNPGTLFYTLRCSTPGQTASGTQVGPNGSFELLQKRKMFHREILFMMDLNLYLCLLLFMFVVVYVQKMTFRRSCENEIKVF